LRLATALAVGATSLLASVGLVARLITAGSATGTIVDNYHVLDAISAATIGLGITVMIMAVLANPPTLAAIVILGGPEILILVGSPALATALAQGMVVALSGILLSKAARFADSRPHRSGNAETTRRLNPDGTPNLGSTQPAARSNVDANRLARKLGFDSAEELKEGFVPRPVARWDMYKDTKTGLLWLRSKDGLRWVNTWISLK
jgi:hypothetical protein